MPDGSWWGLIDNTVIVTTLQEAHQTLEDLQASIHDVSDKMKSAAVYFCQDASKFKLEELLTELLTFIKDFTSAKKVSTGSHTCISPP